jgi:hypothetical protein
VALQRCCAPAQVRSPAHQLPNARPLRASSPERAIRD